MVLVPMAICEAEGARDMGVIAFPDGASDIAWPVTIIGEPAASVWPSAMYWPAELAWTGCELMVITGADGGETAGGGESIEVVPPITMWVADWGGVAFEVWGGAAFEDRVGAALVVWGEAAFVDWGGADFTDWGGAAFMDGGGTVLDDWEAPFADWGGAGLADLGGPGFSDWGGAAFVDSGGAGFEDGGDFANWDAVFVAGMVGDCATGTGDGAGVACPTCVDDEIVSTETATWANDEP